MDESDQIRSESARNSERLVFTRLSRKGIQAELAEHLGVSEATISKLNNPENTINWGAIAKILAFLDLQISDGNARLLERKRYDTLMYLAELGFDQLKDTGSQIDTRSGT